MDDLERGIPITGEDFNGINEVAIFLGHITEEFEATDANELARLLDTAGICLIDAREPDEYGAGHIAGALNIPAGSVELCAAELDRELPPIIYGRDGWAMEAFVAADKLRTLFFKDIRVLSGGLAAWKRAGYTVEPGVRTPSISIEPC